MPRLMIVLGSVREGRTGATIAEWVRKAAEADGRFDVDFVDLAELKLPLMDEPNHPRLRQYTKPHTIAWSERVEAADGFLFVVEWGKTPANLVRDLLAAESRIEGKTLGIVLNKTDMDTLPRYSDAGTAEKYRDLYDQYYTDPMRDGARR